MSRVVQKEKQKRPQKQRVETRLLEARGHGLNVVFSFANAQNEKEGRTCSYQETSGLEAD